VPSSLAVVKRSIRISEYQQGQQGQQGQTIRQQQSGNIMRTEHVSLAPAAATLDDKLKEQFKQEIVLTAIRVPKQSTSQYMKLLSK